MVVCVKKTRHSLTVALLSVALTSSAVAPANAALQLPTFQGAVTGATVGPKPVQHDGAPTPEPFTPDYIGPYISDISSHPLGIYLDVVDTWYDIKHNHPETMRENDAAVVDINNNASPERIASAQEDALAAKNSVIKTTSNALGDEAGAAFRAALDEHRLPKTEYLLGDGYLARAGGLASSTGAEKYIFGEKRPFQNMPDQIKKYPLPDEDLYGTSPAFPSGHTNQATWITTLEAVLMPEFGEQLLARGSESGESRLVLGVHYPLDVIGGRMTGTAAAADRWNDPRMRDALQQAGDEIRAELQWRTGKSMEQLASEAGQYRSNADALADYSRRQDYGFSKIYNKSNPMVVPEQAPDLLSTKFPDLTKEQRRQVLEQTADPAGSPLDDQRVGHASWERINLAAAFAAKVTVNADGSVTVNK